MAKYNMKKENNVFLKELHFHIIFKCNKMCVWGGEVYYLTIK